MTKPITEETRRFLVVGKDEEGILHLYQLRMNTPSIERARIKMELLAEHYGWTPFVSLFVQMLTDDEELQTLGLF